MMPSIHHRSVYDNHKSDVEMMATAMDGVRRVRSMPPRTKPDAYDVAAVRSAIQRALEHRGRTRHAASVGAQLPPATLANFLGGKTGGLDLSTAMRLARELDLTVSQLVGETPLDAPPATAPAESPSRAAVYRVALDAANRVIQALEQELADLQKRHQ
jgi:hypothetical protein